MSPQASPLMDPRLDKLRAAVRTPPPHPDLAALQQFGGQVMDWLLHHFATLPDQAIGNHPTRREMEALLSGPPPEEGRDFAQVFAEFQQKVVPNAFRVNHPRFLAFVPGAPTFLSVLGDMLC